MLKSIYVVLVVLQAIILGITIQNCSPGIIICICLLSFAIDILAFLGIIFIEIFYNMCFSDSDYFIEYVKKIKKYKEQRREKRIQFLKKMQELREQKNLEKQIIDCYNDYTDAGLSEVHRNTALNEYNKLQDEYKKEYGHILEVSNGQ